MSTGVTSLPVEIQLKIFSYLPWYSRYYCSRASRVWRDILLSHGQDAIFDGTSFDELAGVTSYTDSDNPEYPVFGIHGLFGKKITLKIDPDNNFTAFSFTVAGKVQWVANFERCYILNDLMFEKTDLVHDIRILEFDILTWNRGMARKRLGFTGEPRICDMTVRVFLEFVVSLVYAELQESVYKLEKSERTITLEHPMQALCFIGIVARVDGAYPD
ncbi:hypothetical protein TWF481_006822 [Arthrobotrys musiformis]|uniref:F-box domain-containing protein n=1 Tax=Arthrobotrys musiformis TaxID=47236 RepID=A0AAV9WFE0_9PEZI